MNIGQRVIISLHDVMPESFRRMEEIIKYLRDHRIPPVSLLVVPGKEWESYQLKRLRKLSEAGYELLAHGWVHHVEQPRSLYHRLHAALMSRNVAEHLALNSEQIRDLMLRSHQWFAKNDLPSPTVYVPPAWALGPILPEHLKQLPYQRIEILRGLLDSQTGHIDQIPMIGFDADTRWRALSVRLWNTYQIKRSGRLASPLRISLHPEDFHLCLASRVRATIKETYLYQNYADTMQARDSSLTGSI